MERAPADRHRPRDDAGRRLILDEVAGPRVLAVIEVPPPVTHAVLEVENAGARLDDRHRQSRLQLRELQREHRGADPAADDADVGFVDHENW